MDKPSQCKGSESNTRVGRDFEAKAQNFFAQRDLHLTLGVALEIGINGMKLHNFDLGDEQKKVVIGTVKLDNQVLVVAQPRPPRTPGPARRMA